VIDFFEEIFESDDQTTAIDPLMRDIQISVDSLNPDSIVVSVSVASP
jgi:hypothetical protein